jgi:hypothetical protein
LPGVPALAYLGLYALLGYGAAASSTYVDPVQAPGRFLSNAAARFPALLVNEVLNVPGEASLAAIVVGNWAVLLWLIPLAGLGLLLIGTLRRVEPPLQKTLLFLLVGLLLSLLPLVGTIPSTRILSIPSLGGSALLAALLWDAARRLALRAERRRPQFWGRLALSALVAPLHLVVAPLASRAMAVGMRDAYRGTLSTFLHVVTERAPDQQFVVLNARDAITMSYVPFLLATEGRPAPRSWHVLAMTHRSVRVRRTAVDALELRVDDGVLLENPLAHLLRRTEESLREGEIVRLRSFQATVMKTSPQGPLAVRFRFDRPLDHPSLVFLRQSSGGLFHVAPPRLGSEVVIHAATGPPRTAP